MEVRVFFLFRQIRRFHGIITRILPTKKPSAFEGSLSAYINNIKMGDNRFELLTSTV